MQNSQRLFSAFALVATTSFILPNQAAACGTTGGPGGQVTVPCPSPTPTPSPSPSAGNNISNSATSTSSSGVTFGSGAIAGGNSTIQTGAVQNTVAGGSVATGAVQNTNNVAGGSVASGAVANTVAGGAGGNAQATTSATNAGNNVSINNPVARQATHMNVAPAPGNLFDCVAQSGFSVTGSFVGAGAIGTSFTTGAKMVEGCNQGQMDRTIVAQGMASNDPAKIVTALVVANRLQALDEVTEARMKLFGRQIGATTQLAPPPAPQGNTVLNQAFYGSTAPTTGQTKEFVCNLIGLNGTVIQGVIGTFSGHPVCLNPKDSVIAGPR